MTGKFFLIMLFGLVLKLVKICFFFNLDIFITHILKCLYQSLFRAASLCVTISRFVYYCRYNTISNSKNKKEAENHPNHFTLRMILKLLCKRNEYVRILIFQFLPI